jgi:hypothetical protein
MPAGGRRRRALLLAVAGSRPLPRMAASSRAALVVCVTILVAAATSALEIGTIASMRQLVPRGGGVVGVDLAPQRASEMLRSSQSESRCWDLKSQPATATRRAAPRRDAATPRSSPTLTPSPPTPRGWSQLLCTAQGSSNTDGSYQCCCGSDARPERPADDDDAGDPAPHD